jgi:hypothetical protein
MDRLRPLLFATCLVAFCAPVFAVGQTQASDTTRTREQTIEKTAVVTAVDREKREVTLKNEEGETSTIAVGDEVKRFDEIAVGDTVRAKYTLGVTSELRAPTEEEKAEPFVAVEGGGTASKESGAPAAGAGRMFRIVATIEAIDKAAQTATLKGPKGNTVTVQVDDPTLLDKPKVGDTVVITAAESVVLSLEKVKK